jgi:hypothetical protein
MTRAAGVPPETRTVRPSYGAKFAGRGVTDGADFPLLPHTHGTAVAAGGAR